MAPYFIHLGTVNGLSRPWARAIAVGTLRFAGVLRGSRSGRGRRGCWQIVVIFVVDGRFRLNITTTWEVILTFYVVEEALPLGFLDRDQLDRFRVLLFVAFHL